jgi:hypothetical protein
MSPRRHVVITGTGRAGTTFLVELLTHLGLDTGCDVDSLHRYKDPVARAGIECDIRNPECPYIVKAPSFSEYAEEAFRAEDIAIDHIVIPFRDLYAAAESRRAVVRQAYANLSLLSAVSPGVQSPSWPSPSSLPGGLWGTCSSEPGEQERVLLMNSYRLLLACSEAEVPVTLIQYPRLTEDCHYLFRKLQPLLSDVTCAHFDEIFRRVVRPDLVHRYVDDGAR